LLSGRLIPDRAGKISFWIIFAAFNVTFFPMHFLGLGGMPRRTFTYDANMGWSHANFISTVGALILGSGLAYYFAVVAYSWFRGAKSPTDPWDARTLEWSTRMPPPEHNFDVIPVVRERDDFWCLKHPSHASAGAHPTARPSQQPGTSHMPSQSWFPLITASAILFAAFCFANHLMVYAALGLFCVVSSVLLWSFEGPGGYQIRPNRTR
jgi:cytochrome c oxidase subunit 1